MSEVTELKQKDLPAEFELADAYERFREGLFVYLRSKTHDPAVAEDLLHEVFLKALDALDRGARPLSLSAWLRGIAANVLSDHYRRARPAEPLPPDLEATTASRSQAEREMAECLRPFIQGLPPRYRDVMQATVIEGRSGAQLSRDLGLTPSAIKSRAARGRAMLRRAILECCHIEAGDSGEILEYRPRRPDVPEA